MNNHIKKSRTTANTHFGARFELGQQETRSLKVKFLTLSTFCQGWFPDQRIGMLPRGKTRRGKFGSGSRKWAT